MCGWFETNNSKPSTVTERDQPTQAVSRDVTSHLTAANAPSRTVQDHEIIAVGFPRAYVYWDASAAANQLQQSLRQVTLQSDKLSVFRMPPLTLHCS